MTKLMSSKDRLLTAIRHQEPDRVPVGPRVWAWLKDYYGSSSWIYELRAAREFDFDPMLYVDSPYPNYVSTFRAEYEDLDDVRVNLEIERFETESLVKRTIYTPAGILTDCIRQPKPCVGYGIDPDPHWEERVVKSPRDLEALTFLMPKPNPSGYVDVVGIQDMVGDRGLVNLYINSPIDHGAGWCMDLDDLMVATLKQPEFVHALLRLFHNYTMAQIRCALEAGVKVIFTPWYFASMSVGWSPLFYQDFILPLLREQVELVHEFGGIYHYYDDGKVMSILNWLADAGVDVLSTLPPPPMGDIELAQAKAAVGDRLCLNGNIDLLYVIKEGTPELIHKKVQQAIFDAAKGGGFILGTSDSIRETATENVRAYFEAARRYGNYAHLGEG